MQKESLLRPEMCISYPVPQEPPPSEEVSGFQEQTASPVAMVSSSELPQEGQSLLCGHLIQLHHCTLHLSENDFL